MEKLLKWPKIRFSMFLFYHWFCLERNQNENFCGTLLSSANSIFSKILFSRHNWKTTKLNQVTEFFNQNYLLIQLNFDFEHANRYLRKKETETIILNSLSRLSDTCLNLCKISRWVCKFSREFSSAKNFLKS